MTSEIGWKFPPLNGGQGDGFNNSGIATFQGNPLKNLAREVIQNSVDARKDLDKPVHVSFELRQIRNTNSFGKCDLYKHIEACIEEIEDDEEKAINLINCALKILAQDCLPFLCISDRNTTGLRDEEWRYLVKMQGRSKKREAGAGGSFGIGKYAPFTLSPLRTVCYWTCYRTADDFVEKFQGKAVLMSHKVEVDKQLMETQGTGFYGATEGCRELTGIDIPSEFRLFDRNQRDPIQGTALWIAGFQAPENWQSHVALSIVESYFYAIDQGLLSITVEPDLDSEVEKIIIDNQTLEWWFDYLDSERSGLNNEDRHRLSKTRVFRKLINGKEHAFELLDDALGLCKLWIKVEQNMPSEVALIRGTGMLITTQQDKLKRFPGYSEFAAVCIVDSPEGNKLLRQMENPQHDQFEPERLLERDRDRGIRALKRLTDWIREMVRSVAISYTENVTEQLHELARYLPDLDLPGPFDKVSNERQAEPAFGIGGEIRRTPPQLIIRPSHLELEREDSEGGIDVELELTGGKEGYKEKSSKNSNGNTSKSKKNRGVKSIKLEDVRIIPKNSNENLYKLSFMPIDTGVVNIELSEAGDSTTFNRSDICVSRLNGDSVSLKNFEVHARQKVDLLITGEEPIGDKAWVLVAYPCVKT